MVRLAVALATPVIARPEVLQTLRLLASPTRVEPGCLDCRVWSDDDDPIVHYVEEWSTEEAMRQRVRSVRFTQLLEVLEAAATPPTINFEFVNQTRGLDYVEEVRQPDDENESHLASQPRRNC